MLNKEILNKISLPRGMYKVIKCIQENKIYEVEELGLIKLAKWDGDTYHSVVKINETHEEIENLNLILKPRYWITINGELFEQEEPIYFYCK